jgi:hypothetical protein
VVLAGIALLVSLTKRSPDDGDEAVSSPREALASTR